MTTIEPEAQHFEDPEFGPGDLPPESEFTIIDHAALWISRVTMFLVAAIVVAIFYEVVARYFFRAPTLWANELSLFLGGMSYLFAGLFAMQQRSHIRVTVLYERVSPRLRRVFDAIALVCVLIFSAGVVVGGFPSAWRALITWERYGTAWNPPIPAVLKPLILVVVILIAIQAVNNFVVDLRRLRRG
jgi:TRAP-type C4-dicarboxylate transport system permease small subunit